MSLYDKPARSNNFKVGLEEDESRRKRGDGLLDLRRTQRKEEITKRRQNRSEFLTVDEKKFAGVNASHITELYQGIMSNDPRRQLNCSYALRRIIAHKQNPPINRIIESGAIPRLVEFLRKDTNQKLQYEAAWILTNVASGTTDNTLQVVKHNAVPEFVRLLSSVNLDVADQACWALGNVSGDSSKFRDIVINSGIIEPLLTLFVKTKKSSVLRTATWVLSNLCRGKPEPDFNKLRQVLPFLVQLIDNEDVDIVSDAAWAISFLSDEDSDSTLRIEEIVSTGVIGKIVKNLLKEETPKVVKKPFLRLIGNIVTGNEKQTQVVIDCGGLEALNRFLDSSAREMRKETVWAISNIAAGTTKQVNSLINSGLIKKVLDNFTSEPYEVKSEIAWVIANISVSNSEDYVKYLVDNGSISHLCEILLTKDLATILVSLRGLKNILEVGRIKGNREGAPNRYADSVEELGGLDKLEKLQENPSNEVYEISVMLIETYFQNDEPLPETQVTNEQSSNGDVFSFGESDFMKGNSEFKF